MSKLSKITISIVILISAFNGSIWAQNSELNVDVTGFNSAKGTAIVYVYNSKKGFPSDANKAVRVVNCKIKDGACTTTITGLSLGEYAISVLHDENSNDKLDANFLGMPKEGTGVSNNPDSQGPPSYSEAKITLAQSNVTIEIKIKYL
jgi:uncharacterized protein (DUF2141 family)